MVHQAQQSIQHHQRARQAERLFSAVNDIYYQEKASDTTSSPKSSTYLSKEDLLLAVGKAQDLLKGQPLRTSMQTALLGGAVARVMGLSSRQITAVMSSALVCDMGLSRLAGDIHQILPSEMSEKHIFRRHTLIAARIVGNPHEIQAMSPLHQLLTTHPQSTKQWLQEMGLSEDIVHTVEAHHELWDGTGFPFGLQAEAIPIEARILGFVDAVQSVMLDVTGLTTRDLAVRNFLDNKVVDKYDPAVISAFNSVLDDHPELLKRICTSDVDEMFAHIYPATNVRVSATELMGVNRVMGNWLDSLAPMYYQNHAQQTADYAQAMGKKMDIPEAQLGELLTAAYWHDLGMLSVPVGILLRQGPLHDDDWELIQRHPYYVEEILKDITSFHNVSQWCVEHQERMGGKGYPYGKRGYEISVGGRLLALADTMVGLTSPRPYRAYAYDAMDALPVIGQGRYHQYDHQLLGILKQVVLDRTVPETLTKTAGHTVWNSGLNK